MLKKLKIMSLAGAAIVMGAMTLVPATPAEAQSRHSQYRGHDYDQRYRGHNYRNHDRRDYRRHASRRAYQRCDKGDGGTVIGAIAGGLLGHEVVGRRGDKTLGTVLGAGAGALAGRAIDRADNPRYCR
ncbi:glycine zipper 2TM domain-containing protein [Hephaestia sp. GCM10023244]|uniref:glycine zipper 2TM domain-containing protein n=1 Tax=unclassified Hephaestia TaxID=2631281 RepID=UPI0020778666|nr:glycine zipper 2TM domain-containing protein [Hephaestia sp. MAHUQ-44]MCM8731020.1 glycine zipper 2TM domain-containing protein [Hephaestia sp. MAHUQ-44]